MTDAGANCCLLEVFAATTHGLQLSPTVLRRVSIKQAGNIDWGTLGRLVEPLPLSKPSQVAEELDKIGGAKILLSEEAQAEIGEWGARNQAAQLLQELWKTISACSMAYKQGKLMGSCAVMRALPVLAISGFTPGGEVLRQDIAVILQSDVGDAPTLLRRYRAAVQSGDSEVIEAIGRRIGLDPMWDRWVSGFLTEAKALARPQEPSTHWEFPNSPMSKENSADICDWLFRRR